MRRVDKGQSTVPPTHGEERAPTSVGNQTRSAVPMAQQNRPGIVPEQPFPSRVPNKLTSVPAARAAVTTVSPIKAVVEARPDDLEAIVALQARYQLHSIDVANHPENGWLMQMSEVEQLRFALHRYKDIWVAKDAAGKIIAYQTVTAPDFISRPADKHRFFGPQADEANEVLRSGRFIYMSQIVVDPALRGRGVAAELQSKVLAHYGDLPLVAHVAAFTQADVDAAGGDWSKFEAASNNVASHRYHQAQGYVPVAWTSDLRGVAAYNSGVEPPTGPEAIPAMGVLYVNFRGDAAARQRTQPYVDPVRAVLDAPIDQESVSRAPWANPFPVGWPDDHIDMSFDEGGFLPKVAHFEQFLAKKKEARLRAIRR